MWLEYVENECSQEDFPGSKLFNNNYLLLVGALAS